MENEDKAGPKGPVGTPGDRGKPVCETKPSADETKPASDETKPAEVKENAADVKEERDWVKEAYECFLKGKPGDIEPLGVIRSFYEANASEELKAKCKAEGKTPEGAYEFMKAVMREAGGTSISDSVGLSICMHYFQDVPALADFEPKLKAAEEKVRKANLEKKYKENQEKHNAEVRAKAVKKAAETRKKNAKAKEEKQAEVCPPEPKKGEAKPKAKKGDKEQGFFFDLLETETASPAGEGGAAC